MDVTVAVCTFGDDNWFGLARARAVPSALDLRVPVLHVHADTLQNARNEALDRVTSEWVCYLDADDELEAGYFDAMERGTADLRAPSVRYVRHDREVLARVPTVAGHKHPCDADCLSEGNWLVIGTVARTDVLREVGGWHDFPVYEDYDMWVRCWQAGATIEAIPQAVYRAHVRPDSRNRGQLSQQQKHAVHQDIARTNGVPVPA